MVAEKKRITAEELLDAELRSEDKHDFVNGKLTEMSGGKIEHNLLMGELYSLLKAHVKAQQLPFVVLNSEMKVWMDAIGRYHYPDATVIASPPQFFKTAKDKVRRDAVTNPVLLVEVLSDETRAFDLGEKFDNYCTLPTFREYLLVEPDKTWVKTIYLEDPAAGLHRVKIETDRNATIHLQSLDCDLKLDDMYKVLDALQG